MTWRAIFVRLYVLVAKFRARKNAPRVKLVDLSSASRGVLARDPHESLYDTDAAVIARLLRGRDLRMMLATS